MSVPTISVACVLNKARWESLAASITTLNHVYEPDALISKSLGPFKRSSRKVLRLRVIEYQNGVSTEARALPSELGVARLSRYPPAFERERKMSYEDYYGS